MYFLKDINIMTNHKPYSKMIQSIENINKYNLDIESLFIQLRHQLTNG